MDGDRTTSTTANLRCQREKDKFYPVTTELSRGNSSKSNRKRVIEEKNARRHKKKR